MRVLEIPDFDSARGSRRLSEVETKNTRLSEVETLDFDSGQASTQSAEVFVPAERETSFAG